jgi:PAS domain S-box-containing protein
MSPLDSSELQLQIQHRLVHELAASEKRYRELVEHLREAIFECDSTGRLIFVNQAWVEILGYPISESVGHSLTEFIDEEDCEGALASMIAGEGRPMREPRELRFRHKNSDVVWLELSARTVDDGVEPGAVNRIVGSLYNVNDRKRAREELQKANDQLEVRVEERTTALRETNQRLQQEVAEREQAEEALLQAKEAAEAATRAKSEFLAKMSHELRTPMNAIIGFTRLVMRRCKDILPAMQFENLGKILISAERLLALINDILDLAKVEAGRTEIRPVTFALEPLIHECLHTAEPMLRGEKVRLLAEVSPGLPPLTTDKDRLQQILTNLLGNAVKFTENGSIKVTAEQRGGEIAIAVADTGIGIPAQALERIFEEFHQVDAGTTRQYGGTGLGLSISRHFARLLGGDITVKSTAGLGSTFSIVIPVRNEAGRDAARHAHSSSDDSVTSLPVPHQKNLLVIDDDPNVVYLLRENLAEAGFSVVGAGSADEGRRRARQFRPFAIILDILMPQQDGWQMLHELKNDASMRDIPIIVLSVVDNKELAYRLGAFDCLLKPVDRDLMLATLSRIEATMRGQGNEKNPDRGGR